MWTLRKLTDWTSCLALGGLASCTLTPWSPPFDVAAFQATADRATVRADGCLKKTGPLRWWRIEEHVLPDGTGEASLLSGANDAATWRCIKDSFERIRIPPFTGRDMRFEISLREGDPEGAPEPGIPQALPAHEALRVALSPALREAQRCLPASSPPALIEVTVARGGEVAKVVFSETSIAESAQGECITRAFLAAEHVPEFKIRYVTLHFTVRGDP